MRILVHSSQNLIHFIPRYQRRGKPLKKVKRADEVNRTVQLELR